MLSVTRQLADLLANTSYADLPNKTIHATRRSILDWLGSALAGSTERPARIAQGIAAQLGTSDEATVFGADRASAAAAALANGVASHILELDDVHKGSTLHAAAPVIPAALAVAEREHASGRSFVAAVALGYEAAFRIGEAVNPSHYRFWHPTGTAATFGAAAAAGSLLRLTTEQMLHALGTAGTQASGLWEFNADGAMSKHLHPGKAAFNGLLSADFALAGFTGASRILEGKRGFFRATSVTHDASRITDGLGERWKIAENCYKLHSCCGHTHTAIDVALQLRAQQHWQGQDALANIAEIHIESYGPGYEIVKELCPHSSYQAKFSIAYCVAAALLEGRVGLEQFSDDRFQGGSTVQDSVSALLRRVRVTVERDLTQKYPKAWPARVTLTLRDGCKLTGASDFPRGNPENPVSTLELEQKFRSLIEPRFGPGTVIAALRALEHLEACEDMASAFHDLIPGRHEPVPRS
jgi:2-methylcitrate dehydratase PrpD